MLGPMGSTIISILRVLTPAEIDRYTESSELMESFDLKVAVGAEGFEATSHGDPKKKTNFEKNNGVASEDHDDDRHAKIIPINQEAKEELEKIENIEPTPQKKEILSKIKLEELGINSIGSTPPKKLIERDKAKNGNESTTVFILDQREKLKKSQSLLVGQAAIIEYRKSSSQEIFKYDDDDDEEQVITGSTGILINKKQF